MLPLFVAVATVFSACQNADLLGALKDHDCRADAEVRVSNERTAILFLTTHVYMPIVTLNRGPYRAYANDVVPTLIDDVNDLFDSAGVNVLLSIWTGEVSASFFLANVALTEGGIPEELPRAELRDAAREDLSTLHVHWSPKSTQANIAGYAGGEVEVLGEPPLMWAGLIEDPLGDERTAERRRRILAHELGHVFGLGHNTQDPTNLMFEGGTGEALTASDLQAFWDDFNNDHPNFRVISCLKDAELRRVVDGHAAQEIDRAVDTER